MLNQILRITAGTGKKYNPDCFASQREISPISSRQPIQNNILSKL
jgi:hypothetical protein